jgi:hypothetical protein
MHEMPFSLFLFSLLLALDGYIPIEEKNLVVVVSRRIIFGTSITILSYRIPNKVENLSG